MLTTIEFAYFEEPPFSRTEPGCIADQFRDLPEPYLDALGVIIDQIDALVCARCQDAVGFVLEGDRDEYTGWECLGLARLGDGPVAMLCEICTPWVPEVNAPAHVDLPDALSTSHHERASAGTTNGSVVAP